MQSSTAAALPPNPNANDLEAQRHIDSAGDDGRGRASQHVSSSSSSPLWSQAQSLLSRILVGGNMRNRGGNDGHGHRHDYGHDYGTLPRWNRKSDSTTGSGAGNGGGARGRRSAVGGEDSNTPPAPSPAPGRTTDLWPVFFGLAVVLGLGILLVQGFRGWRGV